MVEATQWDWGAGEEQHGCLGSSEKSEVTGNSAVKGLMTSETMQGVPKLLKIKLQPRQYGHAHKEFKLLLCPYHKQNTKNLNSTS